MPRYIGEVLSIVEPMLFFWHFMLSCWSGLPDVRTGKRLQCFLATRVVLYLLSIVHVTGTMG